MSPSEHRSTRRKRLIREKLDARPFWLLEELRWHCYREEHGADGGEMPESYQKSFNRTLRQYHPELTATKYAYPETLPAGLVARAAVYRLPRWELVERFTTAPDPTVYCRYWYLPTHKMVRCTFFEHGCERSLRDPPEPGESLRVGMIIFPVPSMLTVIGDSEAEEEDMLRLASVPWRLVRDTLIKDSPLRPHQSIRTRWRSYLNWGPSQPGTTSVGEDDDDDLPF